MPQELRYWDRVGFMVSKQQAEEVASRMNTATGKTLDEDLEDYVESSVDINAVLNEITILFENPPIDNQELSEDNQAIITMMQFEQGKKQFIMDRKAEGLELAEAKEAYEFAKAKEE